MAPTFHRCLGSLVYSGVRDEQLTTSYHRLPGRFTRIDHRNSQAPCGATEKNCRWCVRDKPGHGRSATWKLCSGISQVWL